MLKALQSVSPLLLLLMATLLEVCGDAVIRIGVYKHAGSVRLGLFAIGAALLFGYGSLLNIAPIQFGRVVGLYIATLFVVWQLINAAVFRVAPTMPILAGGMLIIAGGMVVTFWKT